MERWRGTVAVTPYDRRSLVVTESILAVDDPLGSAPRVEFDLAELAQNGVLLPQGSTMTLVDKRGGPDAERLQLRAVDPPSFDDVDWPPGVRELVAGQVAASEAARVELRRQLTLVVAWTITGLGVLLLVLVAVLLLA